MTPEQLAHLREFMTEAERAEVDALIAQDLQEVIWRPLPGPQTLAYNSVADVIGYGGAAGGGKTDLAVGKALTHHRKAAFFRREATQLTGILDRLSELLGGRDGYNGQDKIWRQAGPRSVQLEFGSTPNPGDETKHQGRPKDLLVIDEAANFLEGQVRFLMGWVRSVDEGQRCQTLMTFNPPTNAEGRWVVAFFAPWLDRRHPLYPTEPGRLRWVAVIDGKDVWLEDDDSRPFVLVEGERVYDFNPTQFKPTEIIQPQSRTFIPSRISDNPYLMGTNYLTTLQAMPEPLRSQMLNGDFEAGMEDDAYQVIPTAWVDAAMARWAEKCPKPPMDSIGLDVARGGNDNNVLARRHGWWFDRLVTVPGREGNDGPKVAALAIANRRDNAPIHIDVIGVGASPYDFLVQAKQDVYGINGAEGTGETDKSGRLAMFNVRSALWWHMREALDPEANNGIALPPDARLRADLCAPRWKLTGGKIQVESREDIIKRIGRSPDWASAVILANMDTPKRLPSAERRTRDYNPVEYASVGLRGVAEDYDPLDHAFR